jgi:hypothetical protein
MRCRAGRGVVTAPGRYVAGFRSVSRMNSSAAVGASRAVVAGSGDRQGSARSDIVAGYADGPRLRGTAEVKVRRAGFEGAAAHG